MLILTRSKDQVITIGDSIRITIVEVRGAQGASRDRRAA
jgi:sRNA-binding carbon storage regulator CsrA